MEDEFGMLEEFTDESALDRHLESLLDDASHHLPDFDTGMLGQASAHHHHIGTSVHDRDEDEDDLNVLTTDIFDQEGSSSLPHHGHAQPGRGTGGGIIHNSTSSSSSTPPHHGAGSLYSLPSPGGPMLTSHTTPSYQQHRSPSHHQTGLQGSPHSSHSVPQSPAQPHPSPAGGSQLPPASPAAAPQFSVPSSPAGSLQPQSPSPAYMSMKSPVNMSMPSPANVMYSSKSPARVVPTPSPSPQGTKLSNSSAPQVQTLAIPQQISSSQGTIQPNPVVLSSSGTLLSGAGLAPGTVLAASGSQIQSMQHVQGLQLQPNGTLVTSGGQQVFQLQLQPNMSISNVVSSSIAPNAVKTQPVSVPLTSTALISTGKGKQPHLLPKPAGGSGSSPRQSKSSANANRLNVQKSPNAASAIPSAPQGQTQQQGTQQQQPIILNQAGIISNVQQAGPSPILMGQVINPNGGAAGTPMIIQQPGGAPGSMIVIRPNSATATSIQSGSTIVPIAVSGNQAGQIIWQQQLPGQLQTPLQQHQVRGVLNAAAPGQVKLVSAATAQGQVQMQQIQTPSGPKLIAVPIGQTIIQGQNVITAGTIPAVANTSIGASQLTAIAQTSTISSITSHQALTTSLPLSLAAAVSGSSQGQLQPQVGGGLALQGISASISQPSLPTSTNAITAGNLINRNLLSSGQPAGILQPFAVSAHQTLIPASSAGVGGLPAPIVSCAPTTYMQQTPGGVGSVNVVQNVSNIVTTSSSPTMPILSPIKKKKPKKKKRETEEINLVSPNIPESSMSQIASQSTALDPTLSPTTSNRPAGAVDLGALMKDVGLDFDDLDNFSMEPSHNDLGGSVETSTPSSLDLNMQSLGMPNDSLMVSGAAGGDPTSLELASSSINSRVLGSASLNLMESTSHQASLSATSISASFASSQLKDNFLPTVTGSSTIQSVATSNGQPFSVSAALPQIGSSSYLQSTSTTPIISGGTLSTANTSGPSFQLIQGPDGQFILQTTPANGGSQAGPAVAASLSSIMAPSASNMFPTSTTQSVGMGQFLIDGQNCLVRVDGRTDTSINSAGATGNLLPVGSTTIGSIVGASANDDTQMSSTSDVDGATAMATSSSEAASTISAVGSPKTPTMSVRPRRFGGSSSGRTPLFEDETLPAGWHRKVSQRKSGASAGRYEVFIIGPTGKRFRSRNELKMFFEKTGEKSLNPEDFDFSTFGRNNPKGSFHVSTISGDSNSGDHSNSRLSPISINTSSSSVANTSQPTPQSTGGASGPSPNAMAFSSPSAHLSETELIKKLEVTGMASVAAARALESGMVGGGSSSLAGTSLLQNIQQPLPQSELVSPTQSSSGARPDGTTTSLLAPVPSAAPGISSQASLLPSSLAASSATMALPFSQSSATAVPTTSLVMSSALPASTFLPSSSVPVSFLSNPVMSTSSAISASAPSLLSSAPMVVSSGVGMPATATMGAPAVIPAAIMANSTLPVSSALLGASSTVLTSSAVSSGTPASLVANPSLLSQPTTISAMSSTPFATSSPSVGFLQSAQLAGPGIKLIPTSVGGAIGDPTSDPQLARLLKTIQQSSGVSAGAGAAAPGIILNASGAGAGQHIVLTGSQAANLALLAGQQAVATSGGRIIVGSMPSAVATTNAVVATKPTSVVVDSPAIQSQPQDREPGFQNAYLDSLVRSQLTDKRGSVGAGTAIAHPGQPVTPKGHQGITGKLGLPSTPLPSGAKALTAVSNGPLMATGQPPQVVQTVSITVANNSIQQQQDAATVNSTAMTAANNATSSGGLTLVRPNASAILPSGLPYEGQEVMAPPNVTLTAPGAAPGSGTLVGLGGPGSQIRALQNMPPNTRLVRGPNGQMTLQKVQTIELSAEMQQAFKAVAQRIAEIESRPVKSPQDEAELASLQAKQHQILSTGRPVPSPQPQLAVIPASGVGPSTPGQINLVQAAAGSSSVQLASPAGQINIVPAGATAVSGQQLTNLVAAAGSAPPLQQLPVSGGQLNLVPVGSSAPSLLSTAGTGHPQQLNLVPVNDPTSHSAQTGHLNLVASGTTNPLSTSSGQLNLIPAGSSSQLPVVSVGSGQAGSLQPTMVQIGHGAAQLQKQTQLGPGAQQTVVRLVPGSVGDAVSQAGSAILGPMASTSQPILIQQHMISPSGSLVGAIQQKSFINTSGGAPAVLSSLAEAGAQSTAVIATQVPQVNRGAAGGGTTAPLQSQPVELLTAKGTSIAGGNPSRVGSNTPATPGLLPSQGAILPPNTSIPSLTEEQRKIVAEFKGQLVNVPPEKQQEFIAHNKVNLIKRLNFHPSQLQLLQSQQKQPTIAGVAGPSKVPAPGMAFNVQSTVPPARQPPSVMAVRAPVPLPAGVRLVAPNPTQSVLTLGQPAATAGPPPTVLAAVAGGGGSLVASNLLQPQVGGAIPSKLLPVVPINPALLPDNMTSGPPPPISTLTSIGLAATGGAASNTIIVDPSGAVLPISAAPPGAQPILKMIPVQDAPAAGSRPPTSADPSSSQLPMISKAKKIAWVESQIRKDQAEATNPNYQNPFRSREDACKRLLRFHVFDDDEGLTLEEFVTADEEFEAKSSQLLSKYHSMLSKYHILLLQESTRLCSSSEEVMLARYWEAEERNALAIEKDEYVTNNARIEELKTKPDPAQEDVEELRNLLAKMEPSFPPVPPSWADKYEQVLGRPYPYPLDGIKLEDPEIKKEFDTKTESMSTFDVHEANDSDESEDDDEEEDDEDDDDLIGRRTGDSGGKNEPTEMPRLLDERIRYQRHLSGGSSSIGPPTPDELPASQLSSHVKYYDVASSSRDAPSRSSVDSETFDKTQPRSRSVSGGVSIKRARVSLTNILARPDIRKELSSGGEDEVVEKASIGASIQLPSTSRTSVFVNSSPSTPSPLPLPAHDTAEDAGAPSPMSQQSQDDGAGFVGLKFNRSSSGRWSASLKRDLESDEFDEYEDEDNAGSGRQLSDLSKRRKLSSNEDLDCAEELMQRSAPTALSSATSYADMPSHPMTSLLGSSSGVGLPSSAPVRATAGLTASMMLTPSSGHAAGSIAATVPAFNNESDSDEEFSLADVGGGDMVRSMLERDDDDDDFDKGRPDDLHAQGGVTMGSHLLRFPANDGAQPPVSPVIGSSGPMIGGNDASSRRFFHQNPSSGSHLSNSGTSTTSGLTSSASAASNLFFDSVAASGLLGGRGTPGSDTDSVQNAINSILDLPDRGGVQTPDDLNNLTGLLDSMEEEEENELRSAAKEVEDGRNRRDEDDESGLDQAVKSIQGLI